MSLKTHVHIRLDEATGKRFLTKLQELGFSTLPNDKRSYFMTNSSEGRLLIEEEASSDMIIQEWTPGKGWTPEFFELIERSARKYKGDFDAIDGPNGEVHINLGVDYSLTPPAAQAPQAGAPAQKKNPQQQPAQALGGVNMDPHTYQKMSMDAMGNLMKAIALDALSLELVIEQVARLNGALTLAAGLKEGIFDTTDVQNQIALTKKMVANAKAEAQQSRNSTNLMNTKQAVPTANAGQTLYDAQGNPVQIDVNGNVIQGLTNTGITVSQIDVDLNEDDPGF